MDAQNLYTDRRRLTTSAYADGANLNARIALYRYRQDQIDFGSWALAQVDWHGDEIVADVGCGSGAYLRRLARREVPAALVLGIDLSRGMLADLLRSWDAPGQPLLLGGDVQDLPLPSACCDVVLAMHMLYHVPDAPRAVRELRRILRPGGVLLAATNADDDKQIFESLVNQALRELVGHDLPPFLRGYRRFTLENGPAQLQAAFAQVERRDLHGELIVPQAAPILDYIDSMRSMVEPALPDGVTWELLMATLERIVDQRIASAGALRIATHTGVLVCR